MMNLDELQSKEDEWIKANGGYWTEFEILARLTEELGEVSSDLQRDKGLRPGKKPTDLEGEIGDLLFTLAAFANKTGIELSKASEKTIRKYNRRLEEDHGEKLSLIHI